MYDTTATKIIMKDGKAAGIEATGKIGNTVTIHADAVILATGRFGANNDMVAEQNPALKGYISTNANGIQDQGILMAQLKKSAQLQWTWIRFSCIQQYM